MILLALALAAQIAPPGASPRLHSLVRLDGTPVTSAHTGERLLLLGTDLPQDGFLSIGAQLRVEPASRQPHYYEIVMPRTTRPLAGFIDLRRPGTSYWGHFAGRLPGTFTLLPPLPPPPPPVYMEPTLTGLQDSAGRPLRAAKAGNRVRAIGGGFGASGRLWWGVVPVLPQRWSDSLIEFTIPLAGVPPRGTTLTIRRGDGRTSVDGVLND